MRRLRADDGVTLTELLVTVSIMAVVGIATMSVLLSSQRTQQFTSQLRDVTEESRITFERVRKELRQARLIDVADPDRITFWVDRNSDGLRATDEVITYQVVPLAGVPDRWEVVRYDASTGLAGARLLIRTLRDTAVFTYDTAPPTTRVVDLRLALDVSTSRGPDVVTTTAQVRLRNAP